MKIRSSVSAMAVVAAGTASAAPVVFTVPTIGLNTPQQTLVITSGAYTLTLTSSSDAYGFFGDSDGLVIGRYYNYSTNDTDQFTMTISGPTALLLKSYDVDYVSTQTATMPAFEILDGATPVSSSNVLSSTGTKIAGGAAVWNPGGSLTFRLMSPLTPYDPVNDPGNRSVFAQIGSLTFEVSASAVPGSGLVALGTLGLAGVARRRRR